MASPVASRAGWQTMTAGWPWFTGEGRHPIAAYSEFMPPPRLGLAPYGPMDPLLFDERDPWGWHVTEYEQAFELAPGLERIGQHLLGSLQHLASGRPAQGISQSLLTDNPFWPEVLSQSAGRLGHERFVLLMPLALSRTQDDKGRVRWTLLGGSEQGPARAFWQSFFSGPGVEIRRTARHGLASASARGSLRPWRGAGRGSARRRLPHAAGGEGSALPLGGRGAAAELGAAAPAPRERADRRRAVPADVPSVRRAARGRAAGVSGRRPPPAPVPGQPGLLGSAEVPQAPGRASLCHADPPAAPGRPPRGSRRNPGASIGLAARSPTGRAGPHHQPRPPAQ